jgi:ubiquinone/menaquinone biosynthesis C-methylase UbiE
MGNLSYSTELNEAVMLIRSGEHDKAFSLVENLKATSHSPIRDVHLLRGVCLISLNRIPEAYESLKQELRYFPDNGAARNLISDFTETPTPAPTTRNQNLSDSERVNEYWSKTDFTDEERNFYVFPVIRSRSSRLMFGESDATRRDWCEYWASQKYLASRMPVDKVLSICCGFGHLERSLAKMNVAKQIHGIDIATGAIEAARKRAIEENLYQLSYEVADINKLPIPEGTYDVIWANGALHHVKDLEVVIPKLYRSLKAGGTLIASEYVGPNYQQVGPRQAELINAVRHILPEELRAQTNNQEQKLFGKIYTPQPLSWFLENDPSESIRSAEVIPVLKTVFDVVDERPFLGTLLYYALDETFYRNFNPNNSRHTEILNTLFTLEENLYKAGEIRNDNALIICRKR